MFPDAQRTAQQYATPNGLPFLARHGRFSRALTASLASPSFFISFRRIILSSKPLIRSFKPWMLAPGVWYCDGEQPSSATKSEAEYHCICTYVDRQRGWWRIVSRLHFYCCCEQDWLDSDDQMTVSTFTSYTGMPLPNASLPAVGEWSNTMHLGYTRMAIVSPTLALVVCRAWLSIFVYLAPAERTAGSILHESTSSLVPYPPERVAIVVDGNEHCCTK